MRLFSFSSSSARRGFTLFELLVVISIIGILIALGTVSFTTAQKNGRDSRRRGDVNGLRNALEQYYAIHSAYPATCSSAALTEVLPNGLPTDPKTGANYELNCSADAYCACALMEREDTGNSQDDQCATLGTTGEYHCAQNLQ